MASKARYIKDGMAGSNNGRGRWEKTEDLKKMSKKKRRQQGKTIAADQLSAVLEVCPNCLSPFIAEHGCFAACSSCGNIFDT